MNLVHVELMAIYDVKTSQLRTDMLDSLKHNNQLSGYININSLCIGQYLYLLILDDNPYSYMKTQDPIDIIFWNKKQLCIEAGSLGLLFKRIEG